MSLSSPNLRFPRPERCKPLFLAASNSAQKNQFPILKLAAHSDTVHLNTNRSLTTKIRHSLPRSPDRRRPGSAARQAGPFRPFWPMSAKYYWQTWRTWQTWQTSDFPAVASSATGVSPVSSGYKVSNTHSPQAISYRGSRQGRQLKLTAPTSSMSAKNSWPTRTTWPTRPTSNFPALLISVAQNVSGDTTTAGVALVGVLAYQCGANSLR